MLTRLHNGSPKLYCFSVLKLTLTDQPKTWAQRQNQYPFLHIERWQKERNILRGRPVGIYNKLTN